MMKVEEISVASCVPFSGNPFKVRDDFDMELLVQSVLDYGVMFPIMVRPMENGQYEIVSGHRRVHACEKAGIDKLPAFICIRKPLAGRVVQRKPTGDDVDEKTPFALEWKCGPPTALRKAKGGHPNE